MALTENAGERELPSMERHVQLSCVASRASFSHFNYGAVRGRLMVVSLSLILGVLWGANGQTSTGQTTTTLGLRDEILIRGLHAGSSIGRHERHHKRLWVFQRGEACCERLAIALDSRAMRNGAALTRL